VVILAVLGVVVAKDALKDRQRTQGAESSEIQAHLSRERETVPQEAAGSASEETAAPQASEGEPPPAQPSAAARPTGAGSGEPATPPQQAQAASTPQQAAPKPEGPLPGSELAACLKSGRPTMADFGKGWCEPCKMMVPILEQAAQDYWGKANIVFVELQNYGELGRQYRIAVMPTQVFFDAKGKEVTRHMGYMGTEDIERELAALGVKK